MKTLIESLGPIPYFDDAACKGRPAWFEVDEAAPVAVMYRLQERALHVCAACPALAACARWTDPDPDALVWAQGGQPMFDVKKREKRRSQDVAYKRRRKQEAEAARVRADAQALLAGWRGVSW